MEFEIMSLIDSLEVGVVFLDVKGVVRDKNDYYLKNYEIEEFNSKRESFFNNTILSSEHKSKLEQDGKVHVEVVLVAKNHSLSRVFPKKRLIDNKFLRLTFVSLVKEDKKVGYVVVIIDRTEEFNNRLDRHERDKRWDFISVLGKESYFTFDLNTSEWSFSDNTPALTGLQEFNIGDYLNSLLKSDKNMLMDQWGLSLTDSIQGDIFEYTYQVTINGERRYHSARWTLDSTSSDNPVVYGLVMDITELSKTETSLGESLTQISLLAEQDDIILWKYYVDEDTFSVNLDVSSDSLIEELGIVRDTFQLSDVFTIVSKEDVEKAKEELNRLFNGEISSINLKTHIKNQNDNCIFVTTNIVIQKTDAKGQSILLMGLSKKEPEEEDGDTKPKKKKKMDGSRKTILVAEDIDNNYDLLNIILRREYKLVRAVNGVEAVRLFSEVKPDIILMDMKMPEMGGLEATRLIRMESHDVPIIAVTAFAFESDREVAIEAGCNDFLSKPIDIPVLKSLIRQYIG